jgi:hypothetical protein
VDALLRLIDAYDFEAELTASQLRGRPATDPGYRALLTLPGVGRLSLGWSAPRSASWLGSPAPGI